MTKTMYDAAFLPTPTPAGFDVAAGYVWQAHHEAANIWTAADWQRAATESRWLLPIATCWTPFGDGGADAFEAVISWQGLRATLGYRDGWQGTAFALDMELEVAQKPGAGTYANQWRNAIRSLGYYDIVYSSYSAAGFLGAGVMWLGPPPNTPADQWLPPYVLANGVVEITQQKYLGYLDTNTAVDTVPFYDTRPVPPTPKGKRMFFLFSLVEEAGDHPPIYVSNGLQYEWTTGEQYNTLVVFATLQGLDPTVHTLTRAQLGRMVPLGPMPT